MKEWMNGYLEKQLYRLTTTIKTYEKLNKTGIDRFQDCCKPWALTLGLMLNNPRINVKKTRPFY